MRVPFVLPDYSLSPVRGLQIGYTYANAPSALGHDLIVPGLRRTGHHARAEFKRAADGVLSNGLGALKADHGEDVWASWAV